MPACFQNDPYTAGCYSFAQATYYSTSDQNILHCLPNRIYSGASRITRRTLTTTVSRRSPSILVERPLHPKRRPWQQSRRALRDCPPELGMLRPIACCAHSSCGPTVCWLELQYHEKQLMCSTRFCVINAAALTVSARNQPLASVQKLMHALRASSHC